MIKQIKIVLFFCPNQTVQRESVLGLHQVECMALICVLFCNLTLFSHCLNFWNFEQGCCWVLQLILCLMLWLDHACLTVVNYHVSSLDRLKINLSDLPMPCFTYRPGYIVSIPLPRSMFSLLPRELQQGHAIKVTPVLFTIGINETATMAEKWVFVSKFIDST